MNKKIILFITFFTCLIPILLWGQENYEIQVYPAETIATSYTGIELHSNISASGKPMIDQVRPTQNALRQTLEITHGFATNFEIGFYQFLNSQKDFGSQWVGTHIRPKITIPEQWHLPVGLSLSTEIGYQRRAYSADTWTAEIRPIIDKDFRVFYISLNPAFGKSLEGLNKNQSFSFEPSCKVAFHINQKIDFGAEYYGSTGPLFNRLKSTDQQHTLYAALDLNLNPDWEFNCGTGWGMTQSTDGFIVKLIIGYKFGDKNKLKKS